MDYSNNIIMRRHEQTNGSLELPGVDHLSQLEINILNIIATLLPKENYPQLFLTCHKFSLIIKHKFLEDIFNGIIKQQFKEGVVAQSQVLVREALDRKDLSLKNEGFRNAIASLYEGMGPSTIQGAIDTYAIYKDKPLVAKMYSKVDIEYYNYPIFILSKYEINQLLAYLYCVKDNQLAPPELYLEIYSQMDLKLADAIVDLIHHNTSVSKLDLYFQGWDPEILNKILNAINGSAFIETIKICDLSLAENRDSLDYYELQEFLEEERQEFLKWFNHTNGCLSRIQEISPFTLFPRSGPGVKCILNKPESKET